MIVPAPAKLSCSERSNRHSEDRDEGFGEKEGGGARRDRKWHREWHAGEARAGLGRGMRRESARALEG